MKWNKVIDGRKECHACGIVKLVSEFNRRTDRDGYRSKCKECLYRAAYAYRASHREMYRQYCRVERKANRPHENFKARLRYNLDPEYKVKNRARAAVYRAIKRGNLIKGPCSSCGTDKAVQGHHHDYSKPLDVHWLCYHCHMKEHGVLA